MNEINEDLSDEERAKRRENYLSRLDSEGPAVIVTDPLQIAEAYARLAELGITIELKPLNPGERISFLQPQIKSGHNPCQTV